jgi:protein-tyrosine-phosphatase
MMDDKNYNVLFLCTGNSARSIIGECLLNQLGQGRFRGFSAGSQPKGEIHPIALDLLRRQNFPVDDLRSKNWDEFSGTDAPPLDFVFTLCDSAAAEACPVWPGQPMSAHWGMADPAAVEGTEAERHMAFADTLRMLTNRLETFTSLPIVSLDRLSLQKRLNEIGRSD